MTLNHCSGELQIHSEQALLTRYEDIDYHNLIQALICTKNNYRKKSTILFIVKCLVKQLISQYWNTVHKVLNPWMLLSLYIESYRW